MKIVETYIIWIHEETIFAKLYKCLSGLTYQWIIETKDEIYTVSKEFVDQEKYLL